MFKLLVRFFVKDRDNVSSPTVRRAYGTLCSVYGIFLNLILFAGKYFAGIISGSVAITADAFNNLSDAGSSIITLLGFAIAAKKPDLDHPFGHGRVEYLAGLVLSSLIMVMGFELGKSSVESIIHPKPVEAGLLPACILLASIAVKFYMYLYNKKTGRRIGSSAMVATATDSLSDSVSTAVVLLSMGVNLIFKINIDGIAGLLVACFIVFAGFNAMRDTLSPLLGKAPDPDFVREIEEIVMAHDKVVGIHDLVVHDYGPGRVMISLHAEVNGTGNLFELHDDIDMAEQDLKEKLGCDATIHMDPIESENSAVANMRNAVSEMLKRDILAEMTIHDFRMVPGPTHTNLIFDAAVPATCRKSDSELASEIKNAVHGTWSDCFAVVSIDRIYV